MPDDRSETRGLNQRDLDVLTLQLAWADSLPQYQCPPEKFLRGFLNRAALSAVMDVFQIAQHRTFANPVHAGAWVMSELNHRSNRNRQPEDRSGVAHYDQNGVRL